MTTTIWSYETSKSVSAAFRSWHNRKVLGGEVVEFARAYSQRSCFEICREDDGSREEDMTSFLQLILKMRFKRLTVSEVGMNMHLEIRDKAWGWERCYRMETKYQWRARRQPVEWNHETFCGCSNHRSQNRARHGTKTRTRSHLRIKEKFGNAWVLYELNFGAGHGS